MCERSAVRLGGIAQFADVELAVGECAHSAGKRLGHASKSDLPEPPTPAHGGSDRIQEGVRRGPTALLPLSEAVAAGAPAIVAYVDRLGRPTFHRVFLDALTSQRAVLKHGRDRWHVVMVPQGVGRISRATPSSSELLRLPVTGVRAAVGTVVRLPRR